MTEPNAPGVQTPAGWTLSITAVGEVSNQSADSVEGPDTEDSEPQ